jgi:DNA-binding response OmpR family regulator
MRVLIAEDDFRSRTMLAAVLRTSGYEVLETNDGAEALREMLQVDAPKLAILDWMMPGLDGPEVCRRIREAAGDNPPYIIMLTARSEVRDIVEALEAGADDYLVKPYNAAELEARIGVGQRMVKLQNTLGEKVAELNSALANIKTLHGILPICSYCKKIRDDREGWRQLEEYVSSNSEATFSHGICPECMKKVYPEYVETTGA